MVADMITGEMLEYPAVTVDERWAAQAAARRRSPRRRRCHGNGRLVGERRGLPGAWHASAAAAIFGTRSPPRSNPSPVPHLPVLEQLLPLPGTARAATTGGPAGQRHRPPAGPPPRRTSGC